MTEPQTPQSGPMLRVVAWLLLGGTAVPCALFFRAADLRRSLWLAIACGLAVVGPPLAMLIAGYFGPLRRRRWLYLFFPAASIGGQTMFLSFVARTVASERFSLQRVGFNVNWPFLVAATVGAYGTLWWMVRYLERRGTPVPEMVGPVVAFLDGHQSLGARIVFSNPRRRGSLLLPSQRAPSPHHGEHRFLVVHPSVSCARSCVTKPVVRTPEFAHSHALPDPSDILQDLRGSQ